MLNNKKNYAFLEKLLTKDERLSGTILVTVDVDNKVMVISTHKDPISDSYRAVLDKISELFSYNDKKIPANKLPI